ncbi:MAG: hydrolase [Bryobacterales bacterium]|nr:hydrolase [Bryobacterales bacterium]
MTTVETKERRTSEIAQPNPISPFARQVLSKDGTAIAFDRIGAGPAVILIDGALCYRGMGQSGKLANLMAQRFTVFTYDRRGRGASSDTAPYAVEREVEDIEALLSEAGGTASVWGISSGAVLALEAANRLKGIKKLALYEPPFIVDDSRSTTEDDWVRIGEAVAADRRSDAVRIFLKSVGVPGFFTKLMRLMPMWSKIKAVAHTLPYDGAIVRDNQRGKPLPANRWAAITVPALVMDGGNSPAWMRHGNQSLTSVLPNAQYRTLEGQTHMLKPKVHAPLLVEFFKG